MFVSSNKIEALLPYYRNKLKDLYPQNEIDSLFYFMCYFMFNLERHEVKYADHRLSESELLIQRDIVKRLLQSEPIQHIIGYTEFYGLKLKINHNTLVPRPETEELVDLIIKENTDKNLTFIDIGTGSGCIPIALLKNKPDWQGFGIDFSAEALKIANWNAVLNELKPTSIEWREHDILKQDFSSFPLFDLIISNPPYVLESDKKEMDDNVLKYDPHTALFVPDEDPLLFYRRILALSEAQLKENGKVYFEIHEKYGQAVCDLIADFGLKNIAVYQDLQGKDRIVTASK